MHIIFNVKKPKNVKIQLKAGNRLIDEMDLTMGQDSDSMLITSLDKLLARNSMDGLSPKNIGFTGQIDEKAVWGMVLRAVISALGC